MVHHGIDSFSRLVTFGRFSHKRATTVMSLFRAAIQKYGQPLRIKTDCGSENVDICRNMIDMHGDTSNSVVVSSSAHNQRIECHNRTINEQVVNVFKHQFYKLEHQGILSSLHIHTKVEPVTFRINYCSQPQCFFHHCQNCHFTNLQCQRFNTENHARVVSVRQLFGTTNIPHVDVPTTENVLDDNALQDLMEAGDPLSPESGDVIR